MTFHVLFNSEYLSSHCINILISYKILFYIFPLILNDSGAFLKYYLEVCGYVRKTLSARVSSGGGFMIICYEASMMVHIGQK